MKKSPALRRAEAAASAAPALRSRVLEWQSGHAARSSTSSQDSSAALAEDGRRGSEREDVGSPKRHRQPESDVEKPRKRAAGGGGDGSRLPGGGVEEREPVRYMTYGRFVRKAKNVETAAARKATRKMECGKVESSAVVGAAAREGVLGFTPMHEDEDAEMVDTQHAAPPDAAASPTAETSQGISQCDGDREPILINTDFSLATTTTSDASPTHMSQSQPQQPATPTTPTALSCIERKRLLLSTRPSKLLRALQAWITDIFDLLDPFRDDDACWMHPLPQPPHRLKSGSLRPRGAIEKRFLWSDARGAHGVTLNFGIAVKIVGRGLSREQRDGWLTRGWHLSHLCGNWTCVNPRHATVEPGKVNVGRNACFGHRSGCAHEPRCMKDRKMALGVDGRVVDVGEGWVVGGVEEDGYRTWDFGSDGEERGDEEGEEEERLFDEEYDVGRRWRRNRSSPGLSPCSRRVGGMGVVQAVEQALQRSIEVVGKGDDIGDLEEEEDVEMSQGQAQRVDSFPEDFSFGEGGIETKQDECFPDASKMAEEESQQQSSPLATISRDGEIQSREDDCCLPDASEMAEVRTQELGFPPLDAPSADSRILFQQDDNFLPDTAEKADETQNINSAPLRGSPVGQECQTQQDEHHLPGASDVGEGERRQLDSSLPETSSGDSGIELPHGNDCVPAASEKQADAEATDSPLLAVSSTQDELQTQEDVGSLPDASETPVEADATEFSLLADPHADEETPTQLNDHCPFETAQSAGQEVAHDSCSSSATSTTEMVMAAGPTQEELQSSDPLGTNVIKVEQQSHASEPMESALDHLAVPLRSTSVGRQHLQADALTEEPSIKVLSSIETPDADDVFSHAHTASSATEEDEDEEEGWSF